MPHHLRYQSAEWALHHVVSRCINGFSFLKPTPATVQLCKGVLGRALAEVTSRTETPSAASSRASATERSVSPALAYDDSRRASSRRR